MKNDSLELQRLATAAAPRMDMYSGIHKGLRACMGDTLLALGRMDVADPESLSLARAQLSGLLDLCQSHLRHENDFVHVAMEARAPGSSGAAAQDHRQHLQHIAQLRAATDALATASLPDRMAAAARLYQALASFVAHNFEHMQVEETAHNAVLWAHYSDAELAAIHDALVASIPPEEMLVVARWMLPAMSPAERAAVLGGLRGKAPPAFFEALLSSVRPHLSDVDWAKLARDLGLPAVPGLVSA